MLCCIFIQTLSANNGQALKCSERWHDRPQILGNSFLNLTLNYVGERKENIESEIITVLLRITVRITSKSSLP